MRRLSGATVRDLLTWLELLTEAGVHLTTALETIAADRSGRTSRVARALSVPVATGESFGGVLAAFAGSGNAPYLRILRLMEHGAGEHEAVHLARCVADQSAQTGRRVAASLVYPAIVVVALVSLLVIARPAALPGFDAATLGSLLERTRLLVCGTGILILLLALGRPLWQRVRGTGSGSLVEDSVRSLGISRERWICAGGARSLIAAGQLPLQALATMSELVADTRLRDSIRSAITEAEGGYVAGDAGSRPRAGAERMLALCAAGADAKGVAAAWERECRAGCLASSRRVETLAEPVATAAAGLVLVVAVLSFVRPVVQHYLEAFV